jgi:hypothetical protein
MYEPRTMAVMGITAGDQPMMSSGFHSPNIGFLPALKRINGSVQLDALGMVVCLNETYTVEYGPFIQLDALGMVVCLNETYTVEYGPAVQLDALGMVVCLNETYTIEYGPFVQLDAIGVVVCLNERYP